MWAKDQLIGTAEDAKENAEYTKELQNAEKNAEENMRNKERVATVMLCY
jgi:hypothetical protein